MSEDTANERPPDAEAGPDGHSEPRPDLGVPSAAVRRWRRLLAAGLGASVGLGLIAHLALRRPAPAPPAVAVRAEPAKSNRAAADTAPGPQRVGSQLSGMIVDGAGIPVPGAEIAAEAETTAQQRAAPPAIATFSTPDGRFVLGGLAPGRYRVRVSGAGVLAAELRYVHVPADDARIVVSRRVSLEGSVVDGARPMAGATVAVLGDAIGGVLEVKADAKGRFSVVNLPEGRYQIYGWRAELAARAVRVARFGAGPFAPVELRVEAAAIVVGTVVDRDEGTGVVAAIELRPSTGDAPPRFARSGADGVFRIEGVPTGRWIADAFAPGYVSLGGVEIDAGKATPELAVARGAAIEGRIVSADGKPIVGATVRAFTAGTTQTEYSADVDLARLRRFSGRTIEAVGDAAAPAGDPQLIPRGELGVMVGAIPPLPGPGAQIAPMAAVVDSSAPNRNFVGDPAPLATDLDRASVWTTGKDGKYRIRGLVRGNVSVIASAPGLAESRSRVVAISATGELVQNVDIRLSPGIFIVGKVTDQHGTPVTGAELTARPDFGTAVSAFTGDDGRYRVGPIAAVIDPPPRAISGRAAPAGTTDRPDSAGEGAPTRGESSTSPSRERAGGIELRVSAHGHAEIRRNLDFTARSTDMRARPSESDTWTEDIVLEVADAALAGTVVDSAGVPIGSAQIDVISGAARRRGAVSSSNGVFSIDQLPRGPVRLRIRHPDFPAEEFDAVAAPTGDRVRLQLAPGGAAEGAVVDGGSGTPLSGLTVTAAGPAGASAETSTDKAGHWRLGPLKVGQWKLVVTQPGYRSYTRVIDVPAASRPGATSLRDIRIDLMRGALVGGTVRDSRGARVVGAHIVIRSQTGDAQGDTDARGEFRIHDAPTGDIVVSATRDAASGQTRASVRPGTEVLGLAIELR